MDYPSNYYNPDTIHPNTPVLDDFIYCPFSGTNYDLTWSDESASGAVNYNIQESDVSNFSNILTYYYISNTYYTYNHDVTSNTHYYYRVRARNNDFKYSSWSNPVEVMVGAMSSISITVETRDYNENIISGSFSYILYNDNDPDPWTYNCDSGNSTSNRYTFDLQAGTYNIESYQYDDYTLPAYYGAVADITVTEGQSKEVTIYTSALAVCTVDSNNFIPSEGLKYELYLKNYSGLWQLINTVTPGSNNYTFAEIPAGIYKVKAYTNDNFRGEAVDINVPPKELVPQIITVMN
jgi:hypothetical protein